LQRRTVHPLLLSEAHLPSDWGQRAAFAALRVATFPIQPSRLLLYLLLSIFYFLPSTFYFPLSVFQLTPKPADIICAGTLSAGLQHSSAGVCKTC